MADKTKVIETERLLLRKFEESDIENVFNNYSSRDKVTEFLTWKAHKTIEDTKSFISGFVIPSYKEDDTYRWAIVLKETNEVVGSIDVVRMNKAFSRAELGWVLSDDYWGKGFMPEAAKEVLNYLIEEGFSRIEAHHNVLNEKSGRVMEKIGMKYEGTLKKYGRNNDGELIDVKMYAYVAED